MPISLICGACEAPLTAPDAAAGKRVKCRKCGAILEVPLPEPEPSDDFEVVEDAPTMMMPAIQKAPSLPPKPVAEAPPPPAAKALPQPAKAKPKPVELELDDEDDRPAPKKKSKPVVEVDEDDDDRPAPKKKSKPALLDDDDDRPAPKKKSKSALLDEDDEDDDRPRKRAGKKKPPAKNNTMLLVGIGGGVVGLALVGFLVYWFALREPEVAKAPTNPPGDPGARPGPQPGGPGPERPGPQPVDPGSERPATPPAGWKLVEHPEFSAWFGDKGRIGNEYMDKSPLPQGYPYTLGTRMVTLEPGKAADARPLAVFVVPLTPEQKTKAATNLGDVFKAIFEREFFGPKAANIVVKDATLDGKPAVEWSDTRRGTTMHFLGGVANDRAYLLIAGGQNVTADDDAVKTFRGSFRFGTNVPPVPKPTAESAPKLVATDLSKYGLAITIDLPSGASTRKLTSDPKEPVLLEVVVNQQVPGGLRLRVDNLVRDMFSTDLKKNNLNRDSKVLEDGGEEEYLWQSPGGKGREAEFGGVRAVTVPGGKVWLTFRTLGAPVTEAQARQVWQMMKTAKVK